MSMDQHTSVKKALTLAQPIFLYSIGTTDDIVA